MGSQRVGHDLATKQQRWGCVLEGLWPQVCSTQSHAYNRRLSGMLKKKKEVHSSLYFKKDESFPAFSTYMKCDDSNQVSLSSKLWICWECCFLPGLVKETLLLCTIAVMWPIEGPCLLGALSMNVSRCRFYLHHTLAPGPAPSYTLKGEPAAGICGPCLELFACLSRAFCLSLWCPVLCAFLFVCLFFPLCLPPSWLLINP